MFMGNIHSMRTSLVKESLWDYSIIRWCHWEEGAELNKLTSSCCKDLPNVRVIVSLRVETTLSLRLTVYVMQSNIITCGSTRNSRQNCCSLYLNALCGAVTHSSKTQIKFHFPHLFDMSVCGYLTCLGFASLMFGGSRQWCHLKVGSALCTSQSPSPLLFWNWVRSHNCVCFGLSQIFFCLHNSWDKGNL